MKALKNHSVPWPVILACFGIAITFLLTLSFTQKQEPVCANQPEVIRCYITPGTLTGLFSPATVMCPMGEYFWDYATISESVGHYSGYVLDGLSVEQNGSKIPITYFFKLTPDLIYEPASSGHRTIVFHSDWSLISESTQLYKVTYDYNGGNTYQYQEIGIQGHLTNYRTYFNRYFLGMPTGESPVVWAPGYSSIPQGMEFAGWGNHPTNPTVMYDENFLITNKQVTLYAIWQIETPPIGEITIVFDLNGWSFQVNPGHAPPWPAPTTAIPVFVLPGTTLGEAKPVNIPQRPNYDLMGWGSLPGNSGWLSDNFALTETKTLYAQWGAHPTIWYGGHSKYVDDVETKHFPYAPGTVLTAPYYGFEELFGSIMRLNPNNLFQYLAGWKLQGSDEVLTQDIILYENINLDPYWDYATFINFSINDGHPRTVPSFQARPGLPLHRSLPEITKDGVPALYWYALLVKEAGAENALASSVATQIVTSDWIVPKQDLYLRPAWQLWTEVTLDLRGGSVAQGITKVYVDSLGKFDPKFTPMHPTYHNQTFKGWFYDSALTKYVSQPFAVTQNTTLYAAWSFDNVTIPTETFFGRIIDSVTGFASNTLNIDLSFIDRVYAFLKQWGWAILVAIGVIILVVLFSTFRWMFDLLLLFLRTVWGLITLPFVLIFRLIKSKRK